MHSEHRKQNMLTKLGSPVLSRSTLAIMRKAFLYSTVMAVYAFYCHGCATFQYPPVEKKLFSWQIANRHVDTIKNTILNEGYTRISPDDDVNSVPYYSFTDRTFTTQYAKTIISNSSVQIMVSYKEANDSRDYVRNIGITIANLERHEIPEISAEVNKMEGIIYRKLIEVAGENNVIRGQR